MVLNIFALLFVLGVTFMHSIFGLFSGLINVICAITAMVVAFGCTDVLSALITEQELHPAYTLPICFVLLFFLSHLILRLLADNLIRGNVRMNVYVDWGGAAVCGFVVAQITVGVLVLGFLMLPLGGRVMMFEREKRVDDLPLAGEDYVQFKRRSVWLKPDEFTVGLFNLLSNGSLKGKTTFASVYPDFAQWVFWTGNTVQQESTTSPFRDKRADGFGERGIRILTWWEQKGPVEARYRAKIPTRDDARMDPGRLFEDVSYKPAAGMRLIGMRVKLEKASADRDEGTWFHRFRPSMIRIVGDVRGEPQQYIARILGGADQGTNELRVADLDNNFAIPTTTEPEDTQLDVYFEVDEDFAPRFVEYRRHARAPVTGEPASEAPGEALVAAAVQGGGGARLVGGNQFIGAIIKNGTGDNPDLPFTMAMNALASAGAGDVEIVDGKFKSGRIAGPTSRFRATGPISTVKEFALPEGYHLFQLRCHARQANSLAGNVFNYVNRATNQYRANDDMANQYMLCGYFAIVQQDGEEYIELYITGEFNAPGFRSLLDFKHLRTSHLNQSSAVIGLLFYVPPGCHIGRVENQRRQAAQFVIPGYKIGE